jgi:arylsulfatase A-like enzyme
MTSCRLSSAGYQHTSNSLAHWLHRIAALALIALPVGLLIGSGGPGLCAAPPRPPNIIVILVDDMGYRDLGCYRATDVATPHIDSLARNGARFTNAYSACPVCTPARAALLTGRYQQRYGLEWVISPDRRTGKTEYGLDVREKTLADLLRSRGYATGILGKWHLGDQPQYLPTRRGFDYFYGYLQWGHYFFNQTKEQLAHPTDPWIAFAKSYGGEEAARYMIDVSNSPIYRNEKVAGFDGYLTEVLNREAVDFLVRNKDRPFFLYLAHAAQHVPLEATAKYLDRFPSLSDQQRRRTYAAALSAVDDGVGEILAKLGQLGLDKNTLIFFTSDNGGASFWKPRPEILDVVKAGTPLGAPRSGEAADYRVVSKRFQVSIGGNGAVNLPLSFGKGILYEGGVRVPLLVQWPGVAAAGKVSDAVVSHLDILPTCVAAAGGTLPADRQYDGTNLDPYFSGSAGDWTDRPMYWRVWKDRAVRRGNWKLVWSGKAPPRLYDLAKDVEEEHDLAASHPEVVTSLQQAWRAWNAKNIAPLFQYEAKGGPWTND